jgi:NAD(P)-dependent dehydrogenase (short-subunit alcohol dehydrogenase family)
MTTELVDKVAIVTGGSSGIGLGTARRFLAEGAQVVLADVDRDRGEAVAKELGAGAAFCPTNVSVQHEVAQLVDFAVETFGGLHVMFNNAGISGARHRALLDDDFADFHEVMGVNLLGVMAGTREAARHMSQHGGGSVINISSIGGIQPAPGLWAYHTSKASIIMFSKCAAIDLGRYGIRVNCIAPGNIETPILERTMTSHLPEGERAEAMKRIRAHIQSRQPLQRQGTTDDIAEAALYFAGDRSVYVTGTLLPVDGGTITGSPARSGDFEAARRGTSG